MKEFFAAPTRPCIIRSLMHGSLDAGRRQTWREGRARQAWIGIIMEIGGRRKRDGGRGSGGRQGMETGE